jgi:dual specificity MAP kinase phosphatase
MGRPAAKSISFANPPPASSSMHPPSLPRVSESMLPTPHAPPFANAAHSNDLDLMQQQLGSNKTGPLVKGRPRATTSPWLPSLFRGDHQSWFNDPRFDGSFPSRVLPFLYLGNLCAIVLFVSGFFVDCFPFF